MKNRIWAVVYNDGLVEAWNEDKGPPSLPYVLENIDSYKENMIYRHAEKIYEILKALADWPLHSKCFDGYKAKNSAESLANARRIARELIAKIDGEKTEKTKFEYYKTAFYPAMNEFVSLVQYHKYAHYYNIKTIDGVSLQVFADELTDFVL